MFSILFIDLNKWIIGHGELVILLVIGVRFRGFIGLLCHLLLSVRFRTISKRSVISRIL